MLIVGGSIALMLLITAFFLVNTVADNTRSRVEKELKSLVAREANDVEGFFATYGGVARAFLSSPFLQDFLRAITREGRPKANWLNPKISMPHLRASAAKIPLLNRRSLVQLRRVNTSMKRAESASTLRVLMLAILTPVTLQLSVRGLLLPLKKESYM